MARACPRCGAPIVGQPPVVADTVVADTVVGAVSDAAVSDAGRKAVAAGVAGQALPGPYVPGSGERVPAELRLVLAGYAGIACGLLAGALACATALIFLAFFADDVGLDDDWNGLLFGLAFVVIGSLGITGSLWGLEQAFEALNARIQFSRLLRRPSDPRTAIVTASKRGGCTLILDIPRDGTGGGDRSLSEVRLALWMKADMLVPGETVHVYGGSDGASELLITSPERGRAFLGTVESQSALQPRLLDEKVSGVILVDWAAWAASTTFSSTYQRFGYDMREVDAFRSAVRDTFLGVRLSRVRSDDVRGKQFSTHRPGYDMTQVDAFLDAAGIRLAAMESTDRPAGARVSGAILFGWAEWAELTGFSPATGYRATEVHTFQEAIRDTFLGVRNPPVRSDEARRKRFSLTDDSDGGYDKKQVAAFLNAAGIRLAAMESTDRPAGPLVSGAILAEWAEWADAKRFSTTPRLRKGYATAEVDAFRKELHDTLLGVRQPPLIWADVHRKWPGSGTHLWFSTTRGWSRPGYDVQEVDAFLNMAKLRLAAITPDIEFTLYKDASIPKGSLMSLPPTPSGSPGQPLPQPQPQPWPQQGMQPPADRRVDPDGPVADAASTPTDGDIPGWTPPPWSPDAADTRPFWRRIPAGWLIAGALVLVSAVAGWFLYASQSATGEPEVAPAEPTQVHTGVATPDEIDELGDLNSNEFNIDDSVDLRVGDCFDIKDWSAEIEHVKAVPCTTEHELELFYVGAMGKRSHPTEDAVLDYVIEYCDSALGDYVGKAPDDSALEYIWLVPTDDAWRSGDRTVQCAAYDPRTDLLTRSLRGTRQ